MLSTRNRYTNFRFIAAVLASAIILWVTLMVGNCIGGRPGRLYSEFTLAFWWNNDFQRARDYLGVLSNYPEYCKKNNIPIAQLNYYLRAGISNNPFQHTSYHFNETLVYKLRSRTGEGVYLYCFDDGYILLNVFLIDEEAQDNGSVYSLPRCYVMYYKDIRLTRMLFHEMENNMPDQYFYVDGIKERYLRLEYIDYSTEGKDMILYLQSDEYIQAPWLEIECIVKNVVEIVWEKGALAKTHYISRLVAPCNDNKESWPLDKDHIVINPLVNCNDGRLIEGLRKLDNMTLGTKRVKLDKILGMYNRDCIDKFNYDMMIDSNQWK